MQQGIWKLATARFAQLYRVRGGACAPSRAYRKLRHRQHWQLPEGHIDAGHNAVNESPRGDRGGRRVERGKKISTDTAWNRKVKPLDCTIDKEVG